MLFRSVTEDERDTLGLEELDLLAEGVAEGVTLLVELKLGLGVRLGTGEYETWKPLVLVKLTPSEWKKKVRFLPVIGGTEERLPENWCKTTGFPFGSFPVTSR